VGGDAVISRRIAVFVMDGLGCRTDFERDGTVANCVIGDRLG